MPSGEKEDPLEEEEEDPLEEDPRGDVVEQQAWKSAQGAPLLEAGELEAYLQRQAWPGAYSSHAYDSPVFESGRAVNKKKAINRQRGNDGRSSSSSIDGATNMSLVQEDDANKFSHYLE